MDYMDKGAIGQSDGFQKKLMKNIPTQLSE